MQSLDDLPLLVEIETPKKPKLTKAQRERQEDWQRSQAIRFAGIDYHFRAAMQFYTLAEVQRIWFEEQAKRVQIGFAGL